jgi:hypothetical protein
MRTAAQPHENKLDIMIDNAYRYALKVAGVKNVEGELKPKHHEQKSAEPCPQN